ncbi:MAG: major capsid family protein [Leptodesmis sp.]|uniref:major capsid family protein n=1 Tax=Leptodesmis sp. TaxID=3100501 RepID=UPI003D0E6A29
MTDVRVDSVGVINEALRYVIPELDRTEFEEYKYADPNRLLPRNPLVAPGVDTLVRQRVTAIGQWKLAADYATNVESIDYAIDRVTYTAKYFRAHIEYSQEELDRMQFTQQYVPNAAVNITQEKMLAVAETYQQLLNRMFSVGLPQIGIFGLHTHPDVPRMTAPHTLSSTNTAAQNLAVLKLFNQVIRANTAQREYADTLLLPDSVIFDLSMQVVSSAGTTSVLQYFLDNDPYIEYIETTPELDTAGPGGTRIAQAYRRDPNKVDTMVAKPMTQLGPVQFVAGKYRVDFDAQVSGVHFRRPYSSLIMEGI